MAVFDKNASNENIESLRTRIVTSIANYTAREYYAIQSFLNNIHCNEISSVTSFSDKCCHVKRTVHSIPYVDKVAGISSSRYVTNYSKQY